MQDFKISLAKNIIAIVQQQVGVFDEITICLCFDNVDCRDKILASRELIFNNLQNWQKQHMPQSQITLSFPNGLIKDDMAKNDILAVTKNQIEFGKMIPIYFSDNNLGEYLDAEKFINFVLTRA